MPIDDGALLQGIRADYLRLLAGTHAADRPENVLFKVSSVSLDDGRGDLFVALGLARSLDARGWGVEFQGMEEWGTEAPSNTTICVFMIHGPHLGPMSERVVRIAWVRNWTREWAASPALELYDGVLASSEASRAYLAGRFEGPTDVLPIAVDPDLFRNSEMMRDLAVTTTMNYWGHDRGLVDRLKKLRVASGIHWFGHGIGEIKGLSPDVVPENMIGYLDVADIYARSRIVLDDMTPSTAEFGNQNSRLFEAIAAGALIIGNCAVGLDELGLGATPVATDETELQLLVDKFLRDEDSRRALVQRLRDVILERHTFVLRAETFDRFAERAGEFAKVRYLHSRIAEQREIIETQKEQLRHQEAGLREQNQQLHVLRNEITKYRESRVFRIANAMGRLIPGRQK